MVTLSPQQESAVRGFQKWHEEVASPFKRAGTDDIAPFWLQEGFAGTGKSTILPFFIEACGLKVETDVAFLAPTGKAAKVMTAKLRDQGINKQATTIHRAIYKPKGLKHVAIESQIKQIKELIETVGPAEKIELGRHLKILYKDLDRAYDRHAPSFQLDPAAPAVRGVQLVVVDEASMVGEHIADDLLSFGTPILAIGDSGQLQPVGDTPGFMIREPDNRLTEIHRQALESPIIRASKDVREGRSLQYGSHGGGALRVLRRNEDDVTFDQNRDVQIIVGKNATRHRMTRKLREACGLYAAGPSVGEVMIVTRNSQKHPNLVNGTMLMITSDTGELHSGDVTCRIYATDEDKMPYALTAIQGILEENYLGAKTWTASKGSVINAMGDKECHLIDWGYVITGHKSQGSQWRDVCVHDESSVFREQEKEWLYTCITRASETLTVVTDNGR